MSAFPPKQPRQNAVASSSSNPLPRYARNNLNGQTAYEREKQAVVTYGSEASDAQQSKYKEGRTEFDILRENMRFIRDGEDPKNVSWEERVARAYESKLFKEFALIDLKHYKTKRIALRWRTAEEVINGLGEETCGSLRCAYHQPVSEDDLASGARIPHLRAFELPFAYEEAGEQKSALVKVRVCERCVRKLTYKPGVEGEKEEGKKERRVQRKEDEVPDRLRKRSASQEGLAESRRRRSMSPEERSSKRQMERTSSPGRHPPGRRRSP